MINNRITDPERLTTSEIQAIIDQGRSPTVQFSKPIYDEPLLEKLNSLCAEFGSDLEVRFFGFYGQAFDAGVLASLPNVRRLSVDCLTRIEQEDWLYKLPSLERLSFGVFEFARNDFLDGLPLENLKQLSVSETKGRKLDLGALQRCKNLTDLFIHGHTKNIEALSGAPELCKLRLSGMPKKLELSFVSELRSLRSLGLLLGARRSLDEIHSSELQELEVIRIRGLETLGSLDRFPSLVRLRIEDQLQLNNLSVVGTHLRELSLHNCKNLETIIGLDKLAELEHFRTSRTKLDLEALRDRDWPPSMEVVALYSGNQKWNDDTRVILEQRGYSEFSR